jgi:AAA domain
MHQELPTASGTAAHPPTVALAFTSVELEGYFSFHDPVTYDLSNRGLVVVTGRVEGGPEVAGGVDSNGAGKTALVMAPLWAITGEVDARSEVCAAFLLCNNSVLTSYFTSAATLCFEIYQYLLPFSK